MAYQTLCDDALKNINRKNLTMEHFSDLMASYTEANIPTYSELILGLPGETAESFCQGLCKLLRAGQHNSISVYYCELLPNAPMCEPEYMKKYLDLLPGSVSVLGLMNDHDHKVRLLIDEDLLEEAQFGCHPCVNTSSIRFSTRDLFDRVLPAMGVTYTTVQLVGY
jgi:hypothetical protein